MIEQYLIKKTKKELIKICQNLIYERDYNIQQKEITIKAFNICIKELKEIKKLFFALTTKEIQEFIEQAKESLDEKR